MKKIIDKIKHKINLEAGNIPKTKAYSTDGSFVFFDWANDYKVEDDWFVNTEDTSWKRKFSKSLQTT